MDTKTQPSKEIILAFHKRGTSMIAETRRVTPAGTQTIIVTRVPGCLPIVVSDASPAEANEIWTELQLGTDLVVTVERGSRGTASFEIDAPKLSARVTEILVKELTGPDGPPLAVVFVGSPGGSVPFAINFSSREALEAAAMGILAAVEELGPPVDEPPPSGANH